MENGKLLRRLKVYLPLAALFAILVLLMPRSGNFNYDYRKGAPWMYETLVADFDFPVLKTQEELQEERDLAASSVIPYYIYSENIASALQTTALSESESSFSRRSSALSLL